jgi:hypothetical protein
MISTYTRSLAYSLLLMISAGAIRAQESASSVVNKTMQNEAADRSVQDHVSFVSHVRSTRTGVHLWVEKVVEIEDGPIRRLISEDGQSLSPERARAEDQRIANLVAHPAEFRRANQPRHSDEKSALDLIHSFPHAFLFTYNGTSDGCTKIHFKPDPGFTPSTYEERFLHVLEGTLEIKQPDNRVCALRARMARPVDIGFGLLGHVDQNGTIEVARIHTSWEIWKIASMKIHVTGKLLLVKSLSKEQEETRADIKELPPHLNLAQAAALTRP